MINLFLNLIKSSYLSGIFSKIYVLFLVYTTKRKTSLFALPAISTRLIEWFESYDVKSKFIFILYTTFSNNVLRF